MFSGVMNEWSKWQSGVLGIKSCKWYSEIEKEEWGEEWSESNRFKRLSHYNACTLISSGVLKFNKNILFWGYTMVNVKVPPCSQNIE